MGGDVSDSDDRGFHDDGSSDNQILQQQEHKKLGHFVAKFVRKRAVVEAIKSAVLARVNASNDTVVASNILKKTRHVSTTDMPIVTIEDQCAVMMIELFGFAKVSSSLIRRGQAGVDQIHGTVGRYLCQIVDIIDSFSGDIFKFVGDVMYVSWNLPQQKQTRQLQEAVACGMQLLNELSDYSVEPAGGHGQRQSELDRAILEFTGASARGSFQADENGTTQTTNLKLRIALDSGTVTRVIVGTQDRMDYYLYAEFIHQLSDMAGNVGEMQVKANIWSAIESISSSLSGNILVTTDNVITFAKFNNPGSRRNSLITRSKKSKNQKKTRRDSGGGGASSSGGGGGGAEYSKQLKTFLPDPSLRRLSESNEPSMSSDINLYEDEDGEMDDYMDVAADDSGLPLSSLLEDKSATVYKSADESTVRKLVSSCVFDENGDVLLTANSYKNITCVYVGVPFNLEPQRAQRVTSAIIEEAGTRYGLFHQWIYGSRYQCGVILFGVKKQEKQAAEHAISFALRVRERMVELELALMISICSGEGYVSIMGNFSRGDSLLIGAIFGKGQRIIALPEAENKILCDEGTLALMDGKQQKGWISKLCGKFMLKSMPKPASLFYLLPLTPLKKELYYTSPLPRKVVGQNYLITDIESRLKNWISASKYVLDLSKKESNISTHFIEANADFGKTLLFNQISNRVPSGITFCAPNELKSPYSSVVAYSSLSSQICNILKSYAQLGSDKRVNYVKISLQRAGLDESLANDIEVALGIFKPKPNSLASDKELPHIRPMVAVEACIVQLVKQASAELKIFLLVDNYQWMDSRSLKLLHRIIRELTQVKVVVLTRPIQQNDKLHSYSHLLRLPHVVQNNLMSLGEQSINEMLIAQWGGVAGGISKVEHFISSTIAKVTNGHPVFCELVGMILRTRANIKAVAHDSKKPSTLGVPNQEMGDSEDLPCPFVLDDDGTLKLRRWPTMHLPGVVFSDVVVSILERVSSQSKKFLFTAAVIGQEFVLGLVYDALSGEISIDALHQLIEDDTGRLIVKKSNTQGREALYSFRSSQVVDCIYDSIKQTDKKSIHLKVAALLKTQYETTQDLAILPFIVNHYEKAKELSKAFDLIDQQSMLCYHQHMFLEAQQALEKSLMLAKSGGARTKDAGLAVRSNVMLGRILLDVDPEYAGKILLDAMKLLHFSYQPSFVDMIVKKCFLRMWVSSELKRMSKVNQEPKQGRQTRQVQPESSAEASIDLLLSALFVLQSNLFASSPAHCAELLLVEIARRLSKSIYVQETIEQIANMLTFYSVVFGNTQSFSLDVIKLCIPILRQAYKNQPTLSMSRGQILFALGLAHKACGDFEEAYNDFSVAAEVAVLMDQWGYWLTPANQMVHILGVACQIKKIEDVLAPNMRLMARELLNLPAAFATTRLGALLTMALIRMLGGNTTGANLLLDKLKDTMSKKSTSSTMSSQEDRKNRPLLSSVSLMFVYSTSMSLVAALGGELSAAAEHICLACESLVDKRWQSESVVQRQACSLQIGLTGILVSVALVAAHSERNRSRFQDAINSLKKGLKDLRASLRASSPFGIRVRESCLAVDAEVLLGPLASATLVYVDVVANKKPPTTVHPGIVGVQKAIAKLQDNNQRLTKLCCSLVLSKISSDSEIVKLHSAEAKILLADMGASSQAIRMMFQLT